MTLEVLRAGALTTVQDRGRIGFRHLGVGLAGALDGVSAHIANVLVGNAPDAALLECTLAGPALRFGRAARIALAGAYCAASVEGVALPVGHPAVVPAGATLQIGPLLHGARVYLAIDGGIEVARVMRSAATDLRAGFGGREGRALRSGEVLALGPGRCCATQVQVAPWWVESAPDLARAGPITLRTLPGHDATRPARALELRQWRVSAHADRQGIRLEGAALQLDNERERLSEPVAPGTVQLPPGGQPIVLLADAQTVGGYARIAHVISADLPRLAQCRAGDTLRFEPVEAGRAAALGAEQRTRLARIELAVHTRGDWPRHSRAAITAR